MALYLIRRPFPGASDAAIAAAGYRSEACLPFYPGLRWLQTYWDREHEETVCIYEARSIEDIRRHAEQSHIPCGDIVEVEALRTEPTPEVALS